MTMEQRIVHVTAWAKVLEPHDISNLTLEDLLWIGGWGLRCCQGWLGPGAWVGTGLGYFLESGFCIVSGVLSDCS
jgi:hypothetical protein